MKRQILVSTALAACSIIGLAPIAAASNWVNVVTGEKSGLSYQIDLDSRSTYLSKTGWRHVSFLISDSKDPNSHKAVASCDPYQINVPDYDWVWLTDHYTSYPVDTVAGKIARAACNW